jgi:hypothetical protein
MQRRTFLYLSAYTAAALSLPIVNGCTPVVGEIAIAQPLFFSHLADVKTVLETGKAYRKANPGENDKDKLTGLLLANSDLKQSADARLIQSFLDNKVEADFKTGKIVTVKGWVLSVTEARQCALFSIIKS